MGFKDPQRAERELIAVQSAERDNMREQSQGEKEERPREAKRTIVGDLGECLTPTDGVPVRPGVEAENKK